MSILHPGIMERLGAAGRPSKKTKANRKGEARRIELLGQMWERRVVALGARDKAGLMVLASEYAGLKCPNTAQQIMAEAENL
jgi:hypothetical protein